MASFDSNIFGNRSDLLESNDAILVYGAPESFLIDKNGVIRFKQIGPITEDVWNNKILPLAKQLNQ